jgi:hypothetical protein
MTVMAGPIALMAIWLVHRLAAAVTPPWKGLVAATVLAVLALPTAQFMLALARSTTSDTRIVAVKIAQALDSPAVFDWHASMPSYDAWPPLSAIAPASEYVVVAEPIAARFMRAASFPDQPSVVRDYTMRYGALMERPSIIVRSTVGTFSYRNVPVRIVALRGDIDRLKATLERAGNQAYTQADVLPGGAAYVPTRW